VVTNGGRDVSLFIALVASCACDDGEDEDEDVFSTCV
jgi:hypothetical protein